ncbi:hypothetical protein [Streptomyces sp. NPDC048516]
MNTRKLAGVGIITTALIGTALTSGAVTATERQLQPCGLRPPL